METLKGFRASFSYPMTLFRGSLIGTLIGIAPGIGSSVSNLVSYSDAMRSDPHPESFGKGNPKGVVAAEAANSSSEGGGMVTLLALGIPSGLGSAVMLAAFSMHNVTGGPRFIAQNTDIVYAIIFGNFAQVILMSVLGLLFIHVLSSIILAPVRMLGPSMLVMTVFGAYGVSGDLLGPITLFAFGVLGWFLKRYHYSIPAVVIGLLLGKMTESELTYLYQISGGPSRWLSSVFWSSQLPRRSSTCVA